MKKIIISALFLMIMSSCYKNELNILPPSLDWKKDVSMEITPSGVINTDGIGGMYAIESTPDNGFVIAVDGIVRKYNSEGDSVWEKSYNESVVSIEHIMSDGYLLCGYNDTEVWFTKVNQTWEVEWETLVPYEGRPTFKSIGTVSDGIIIGIKEGSTSVSSVLKLDNDGNLLWENKFADLEAAAIYGFEIAYDEHIFIVGGANENEEGATFAWFAELDRNGTIVNQTIYTNKEKWSAFYGIKKSKDDDFIIIFQELFQGRSAKLDVKGKLKSKNAYRYSSYTNIDKMRNGEVIIMGEQTTSPGRNGLYTTSIAKLNNDGERIWQLQDGQFGYVGDYQYPVGIVQLVDGSYVALIEVLSVRFSLLKTTVE